MTYNEIPKEVEKYLLNDADWDVFYKSKLAGSLQVGTLDDMKYDKIFLCQFGSLNFFIPVKLVLDNESVLLSEFIYCFSSKYESEIFKINSKQASSICTKIQKKYNDNIADMKRFVFDEIMGFALEYVNREYKK